MLGASILLSFSFVGFIYGTGTLFIRGDAHTFGIATGVFALFIAIELAVAIWNG